MTAKFKGKGQAPVILSNKAYVPKEQVESNLLDTYYLHDVFDDRACQKCEHMPERPNQTCQICPNYLGRFKLYSKHKINGKRYYGLPLGDRKALKHIVPNIKKLKKKDKRPNKPIKYDLEFLAERRPHQGPAVQKLVSKGYGCLISPPRTGKTVMASDLICQIKQKTLILAHQNDLLIQFYNTLMNEEKDDNDENIQFTNIPHIEKFESTKIVKICSKEKDFLDHDICLATYQQFIDEAGQKKLDRIKDEFGMVIIDEIHMGSATEYSKVLSKINARWKYGMTATFKRKDTKEFIVQNIVGPPVHKTDAQELVPTGTIFFTGAAPNKQYKMWTYAMRWLERQTHRNQLIADWAVHDIKNGRSILIPVMFQSHADTLVEMINEGLGWNGARAFYGSKPKDKKLRGEVKQEAVSGNIKCVVAMRQLLTGVNVPRWDTIYEVTPINNDPKFEQEVKRICTPSSNKKKPKIRFFIDEFGISWSCFRNNLRVLDEMGVEFKGKHAERKQKALGKAKMGFKQQRAKNEEVTRRKEEKGKPNIGKKL